MLSSSNLPLKSAATIVKGLITEPGSYISCKARFLIPAMDSPDILLGLYEGWLAIASISPVIASITIAAPFSAFLE